MGSTEDLAEFELREKFCEDESGAFCTRSPVFTNNGDYDFNCDGKYDQPLTEESQVDSCLQNGSIQETDENEVGDAKEEAPSDELHDKSEVDGDHGSEVASMPTQSIHYDLESEKYELGSNHVEGPLQEEEHSIHLVVEEEKCQLNDNHGLGENSAHSVDDSVGPTHEYSESKTMQFIGERRFSQDYKTNTCDHKSTEPVFMPFNETTCLSVGRPSLNDEKCFEDVPAFVTPNEFIIDNNLAWQSSENDKEFLHYQLDLKETVESTVENEPVGSQGVDEHETIAGFGASQVLSHEELSFYGCAVELSNSGSEQSVFENTPARDNHVFRECDQVEEVTCLKKGFAKDLAGFWSSPKGDTCTKQLKQPIELPRDDAPFIVENSPQRLEGVVRSDDTPDNDIAIEQGHAKMMVNLFQSKKEENVVKEVKLDINFEEPGVYENNPKEREGIVKSSDVIDDIQVQKGAIKLITGKFESKEDSNFRPREVIKIEPAQGPSVIENTPEPPMADVVRSDTKVEEDLPSLHGFTKNLVQKWKTNDLVNSKSSTNKIDDLEAILKAGMAAESGVFENQPSIRNDVVREDDGQPDVIPIQKTKTTRDLWNQKINQESKPAEKPLQLIRFTPPRELSPPRQTDDSFKSFQQITLA